MPSKYDLYEAAVQSPEVHIESFDRMYRELSGGEAKTLREDFCGTFAISKHWVESAPQREAYCLDLDPEPLRYGRKMNLEPLSPETRRRVHPRRANVLKVGNAKADIIAACNFSFYIFKERRTLLDYFRKAHDSLTPGGLLVLEMAGGPGMVEKVRERRTVRLRKDYKFRYIWDQKSFDPITGNGHYGIHFKLPDGRELRDVFTYDWRLWTIPEVRDALMDAGFETTAVYWEASHKGEGTGEYVLTERGDNDYSWIAYVVGRRKGAPRSRVLRTGQR